MCKLCLLCSALLSAAIGMPAGADAPSGNVGHVFINTPKPGLEHQYETGRKNHMAWHRSQHDTFSWHTWEIIDGDNAGSYVVGTFGHDWKDFDGRDAFEEADGADAASAMGATEASSSDSFFLYRADLSRPDSAAQGPAAMESVTFFHLKPEGVNDFTNGVVKAKAAQDRIKWPQHSQWYQLANGGEGPLFILTQPRANWAAFQAPDKSLDALMEEAYGKKEGAAILLSLRQAIRSSYSEIIRYRPDLSYVPTK